MEYVIDVVAVIADWASDQPESNSQHCAIFNGLHNYLWHDDDCTLSHYPLCEMYVYSITRCNFITLSPF